MHIFDAVLLGGLEVHRSLESRPIKMVPLLFGRCKTLLLMMELDSLFSEVIDSAKVLESDLKHFDGAEIKLFYLLRRSLFVRSVKKFEMCRGAAGFSEDSAAGSCGPGAKRTRSTRRCRSRRPKNRNWSTGRISMHSLRNAPI